MPSLPVDVYGHILSFLPQPSVVQCRLVSRLFSSLATERAFRHVFLEAAYDASVFERIARSDKLRHAVREVTVDTWVGPTFTYHRNEDYDRPDRFLKALPYLRFFPRLKRLNVRFDSHCGVENRRNYLDIEETNEFRFMVLDTAFRCLAGMWTEEANQSLLDELDLESDEEAAEGDDADDEGELSPPASTSDPFPQTPIEVSSLTISNLAGFDDRKLTSSEAFKRVLSNPSFAKLKMLVVVEEDEAAPESSIWHPERYDFFESLPRTWLAPSVAQNLRVLSLYCRDYWGWCPKMDFRLVNPGSGFPNLRVLALGNYVFSHDWQIDWVASLGLHNGRGGLEELYLDDCPVMFRVRIVGPLDESTVTVGDEGPEGEATQISNHGYPRKDIMSQRPREWDPIEKEYSLRWHRMLKVWREKMAGLKVFKMGTGDWIGEYEPRTAELRDRDRPDAEEAEERKEQRCEDTLFLNYDLDPPPEDELLVACRDGTGLRQEREDMLQYAEFDVGIGPSPWICGDFKQRWGSETGIEGDASSDERELAELLAVVEMRRLASASASSSA